MEGYVRFETPTEAVLHWTPDDDTPPLVTIERSEAPHEGFEIVAEDVDGPSGVWIDTFVTPNENRFMYYRVNGTLLHIGAIPYQPAKEILRRDRWFLAQSHRRHSGAQEVDIYIRRTLGPSCPKCWDPVQEKRTQTKCNLCFGTGLANPYFHKISARVANSMPQRLRRPQDDRITQTYESQFWMSNFPLLKPGDLVYRSQWLWRVEHVQITRVGRVITKQVVGIKRMETSRDIYRYDFVFKGVLGYWVGALGLALDAEPRITAEYEDWLNHALEAVPVSGIGGGDEE